MRVITGILGVEKMVCIRKTRSHEREHEGSLRDAGKIGV